MPPTPLRAAVTVAVGAVIAIGLGYAFSYDPEAAHERARIREQERVWQMGDQRARRWAEMSPAEREAEMRARNAANQARYAVARAERATRDSIERLRLDSVARAARRAACGRARASDWSECRPAIIDGQAYIVEIETKGYVPGDPTRKWIRVHDDSGRVVYREDGSGPVELSARVLEDADGKARGLLFRRAPGADGSAFSYHIVVPRGALWGLLSAPFNYGAIQEATYEMESGQLQLAEGNRFFVGWQTRRHFNAHLAYRVDFDCQVGGTSCIAPDSIAGLVRFPEVEIEGDAEWRPVESTVTIEMFPAPRAEKPERVAIAPGTKMRVLGAAGRMPASEAEQEEDWLHISVGGRTGWIHGAQTFAAVHEVPKEYVRFGRPTP